MKRFSVYLLSFALFLVIPAFGQDDDGEMEMASEHDNSAYLGAFLSDFQGSSGKLNQLAGAFSDELYSWAPAEGIRTVSQVFVHVANANYGLSSAMGVSSDMDMQAMMNAEQEITSKEEVTEYLMASQQMVQQAIEMIMNADLTSDVQAFGMTMSHYQVLMILAGHSHEHLGQGIAYARSNGVAPPWSGGGEEMEEEDMEEDDGGDY